MNNYVALMLVSLMLLAGCMPGTTPPVNVDRDGGVEALERTVIDVGRQGEKSLNAASPAVLAVGADQRIFYILGNKPAKFCSEPPPETAVSVAQALASALAAGVTVSGADADVKVGFDQETAALLTQTVNQLFVPSQGLQFYRAGLLGLCQSFSNGSIVDILQFEELYKQLVSESAHLIALEVENQTLTQRAQGEALASLQELADALRKLQSDNDAAGRPEDDPESSKEGTDSPESESPEEEQESYEVTISVFGEGVVTFEGNTCTSSCTYPVSRPDEVVITAKPADVKQWKGCDDDEEGECTIYIDADKQIEVTFDG